MSADEPNAKRRALGTALLALPLLSTPAYASATGEKVRVPAGEFLGVRSDGVVTFRGIRYGADTSRTRFKPAQSAPRETAVIKAWQNGPVCPQRAKTADAQSEDCLRLNIWTTSLDTRAKMTVMVYIHGGAYATGSGNDPLTDGSILATSRDVVVVCVTHRLNAFGYLSLGRLDPRYPDSGNVGQLDLILALEWIRDNIAGFGGDPTSVMVFGQSGGGAKIATLMAMPAAKNLFHRAATMSGQQVTASGPLNAQRRAAAYLKTLAVDPVSANTTLLVEALDAVDPILGGAMYFGPVVDDRHLLRHPFYPDAHPQSLHIPMLLGNTVAETRAFFRAEHKVWRGLNWENLAERLGPELRVDISPERVVAKYRGWFPEKTPAQVFISATTAGRSWRGQIIEAEARATANAPAFVYQLDFENAAHTDDIGLVFGTTPSITEAARTVSARMREAFTVFAKSGDPGWEPYKLTERKTMLFDTTSRVASDPRGRERELFAEALYVQPGT
ncbi:MAG: carboxylesterase/lipase family protein [Rhodocyclaceae bacterium]|nr:carboxylesterase/lipase family protein [Rhodocyclaceae bacterium]